MVRGAADPESAGLRRANEEQRRTVQFRFAEALTARTGGRLRDGHDDADAALAALGPETYGLLVTGRGWSPQLWERWAADTLVRQLLA